MISLSRKTEVPCTKGQSPRGKRAQHTFYIILIGSAFLDLLFLDPKLLTDPPRVMGSENAAVVRDEHFWNTIGANGLVKDGKKCSGILPQRNGRSQDR